MRRRLYAPLAYKIRYLAETNWKNVLLYRNRKGMKPEVAETGSGLGARTGSLALGGEFLPVAGTAVNFCWQKRYITYDSRDKI